MYRVANNASLLTIVGLTGVSSAAYASPPTTVYFDIPDSSEYTDITLAGASSPQYYYGNYNYGSSKKGTKGQLNGYGTAEVSNDSFSTPSFPSVNDSDLGTAVKVSKNESLDDSNYFHLVFQDGVGDTDVGYVYFDNSGTLTSITYEAAPVPEPDAWALLIAGSGLMGGVLRGRRRAEPAERGDQFKA
jgi:hypothetical protein